MTDLSEQQKLEIERTKLAVDCIKHITTLATASLLAVPVILEKFTKTDPNLYVLKRGVLLMVICIGACSGYLFAVGVAPREEIWRSPPRFLVQLLMIGAYVTFFLGIIAIVVFAISNVK